MKCFAAKEDAWWVVRGVDYDIFAFGDTLENAIKKFKMTYDFEWKLCKEFGELTPPRTTQEIQNSYYDSGIDIKILDENFNKKTETYFARQDNVTKVLHWKTNCEFWPISDYKLVKSPYDNKYYTLCEKCKTLQKRDS